MGSYQQIGKSSFQPAKVSPNPSLQRKHHQLPLQQQGGQTLEEMRISRANAERIGDHLSIFSKLTPPQPMQTKLAIGEVGDKYEQEADAVAAEVVKKINAPGAPETPNEGNNNIQNPGVIQPKLQLKGEGQGGKASSEIESKINSAKGGGQSLTPDLQAKMGEAMGADFSGVKVHTNTEADQLNRSLQAKAFATGQDVFFRQGAYAPQSQEGQELIAHELTHVVQQGGAGVQKKTQKVSRKEVATPKSEVLTHLQSLRVNRNHDTSIYRKEIEKFKRENSINDDIFPVKEEQANNTLVYQELENSQQSMTPPILIAQGHVTNLAPTDPRQDTYREQQRVEAINLITSHAQEIINAGVNYEVDPRAIAGAILWEALENPYDDGVLEPNYRPENLRNGPGKVHVFNYRRPDQLSEAEKVEMAGLVPQIFQLPRLAQVPERWERLQQPGYAIVYIAAIMSRHASDYQAQGFYIRNNPGVLCTLYQGGNSEGRAANKARERESVVREGGDPSSVQPQAADEMGPWVEDNLSYIQALIRQGANDSSVTTGEGRFEQYMDIGYRADTQGDYHTALINFGRAIVERPGNEYALRAINNVKGKLFERHMNIGYRADTQGDYHTALINFERALRYRPANNYAVEARNNMRDKLFTEKMEDGYARDAEGDFFQALTLFTDALKFRPGNEYALRAIRNMERKLQENGTPLWGGYTQVMNIGYSADAQGDYHTALINFRRALIERPGDEYALGAIRNVEGKLYTQQMERGYAFIGM